AAAIECKKHDLSVTVLEEFTKAGGRLLGQLHQEPNGEWWNGVKEAGRLEQDAKALNIDVKLGYPVHHIEKTEEAFVVHTDKGIFPAENIIIATGAAEVAAPIPGWTLPGVMSIGAAQVMTNVHRVRVGGKGIVVGVNVLAAAIAREMQLAGIELHSMALPAKNTVTKEQGHPRHVMEELARISHLAPSAFLLFGGKFAKGMSLVRNLAVNFYPKSGVKMWGMPIHIRKAITSINGEDKVESVTMCKVKSNGEIIKGSEETVEVDFRSEEHTSELQ